MGVTLPFLIVGSVQEGCRGVWGELRTGVSWFAGGLQGDIPSPRVHCASTGTAQLVSATENRQATPRIYLWIGPVEGVWMLGIK